MAKKPKEVAFVIAQCPHTWRVLMGKKMKGKRPKWGFFGGQLRENERPECAAAREFEEETGIKVYGRTLHFVDVLYFPNRTIWIYRASIYYEHPIKLSKEHSQFDWWDVDLIGVGLKGKLCEPAKQILGCEMLKGDLIWGE